MTQLCCGDPHDQFGHILEAAAALQPSAVILLGDLEPARPRHVELAPFLNNPNDRKSWQLANWFSHG